MKLTDLLEPDVFFNKRLAEEFEKDGTLRKSIYPNFLRDELTWTGEAKKGSIEERIGVDFVSLKAENCADRIAHGGWCWIKNDRQNYINGVNQHLSLLGLGINPSIDDYLDAGERIIKELGFKYFRFTTEKARAYMNVAEDQHKVFSVDLHDLAIGNLAEQAMREFLIKEDKDFISRSFLFHKSASSQDEKDITIYTPDKQTLGVRCQREFSGSYLYSSRRIARKDKIADYIAFFNHLGHHIFYLTGIVEKEFIFAEANSMVYKMKEFHFPEKDPETVLYSYTDISKDCEEEIKKELNEKLKRRISYEEFIGRLS